MKVQFPKAQLSSDSKRERPPRLRVRPEAGESKSPGAKENDRSTNQHNTRNMELGIEYQDGSRDADMLKEGRRKPVRKYGGY